MSSFGKKGLMIGLSTLILAFACILAVVYLLVNQQQLSRDEIETLQDKVLLLDNEKTVATRKAAALASRLDKSITLPQLMDVSREQFGDETGRREGFLWVDKEDRSLVATLGVLNGVKPNARLSVYEGKTKIGHVVVETPLDVISYVKLDDLSFDELKMDYYRVVSE